VHRNPFPPESETQFLMNLYQRKGLEFAKYINGLFNVAISDEKKGRIIIANDRYGFYPLFYTLSKERFAFASEAKFVLRAANIPSKINKMAISEFFTLSYLLGEKTFFEGIELMKPASIMIFNSASASV
jgi:asparagine synthase (glutamine-hydrolysing)